MKRIYVLFATILALFTSQAYAERYFTNGEPAGAAKEFIDFTLSPKGQEIVDRVGFVGVGEIKK